MNALAHRTIVRFEPLLVTLTVRQQFVTHNRGMHVSSIPAGQGFYDVSLRVGVSSIKHLDVQPIVFFVCQGWASFDTRTMRTEFALSTGLTESGPMCSCG